MLIGLSGYARSGKDTVGKYLVDRHGFTKFAFADALKEVAYILNPIVDITQEYEFIRLAEGVDQIGWDETKKAPEVRRILQVLGTECGREVLGENIWVDIISRKIWKYEKVVITDARFPNELAFIKMRGGFSWWIDRDEVGPLNSHVSENTVTCKDANGIIYNNRDFEHLYKNVDIRLRKEFEN